MKHLSVNRLKVRLKRWIRTQFYAVFDSFTRMLIAWGNWWIDSANGLRQRRNMPVNPRLPIVQDRYYRPLEPRR